MDDWAWRKGQQYGTILVDLERHRVVDLLPERSAESLAEWLADNPTVSVISRDRCGLYAEGATARMPDAQQVADRFHLIVNLSAAIERALEERSRMLELPAPKAPRETDITTAENIRQTDAATETAEATPGAAAGTLSRGRETL